MLCYAKAILNRHFHRFIHLAGASVALAIAILCGAGCSPESDLSEFMDDQAGLLTVKQQARIGRLNRLLLDELDIHIRMVVLAESPADLNHAAVSFFEKHRLGDKTQGARGILFLVDPSGKQVRVEIGYDLEGVYPDAFVGNVERNQMVPFFHAGRVGCGVEATVELFVQRAMADHETSDGTIGTKAVSTEDHLSGGGGATVAAAIGSVSPKKTTSPHAHEFGPQSSPLMTLETYKQVLRGRIKDPELGLYTEETRQFLRQWLVTDAQQENELRSIERVTSQALVSTENTLAAVRFPVENRQASPYFCRRSGTGWMLDFASMHRIIGFNHKNQWFFRTTDHDFMFAFTDIVFDRHGFPHR